MVKSTHLGPAKPDDPVFKEGYTVVVQPPKKPSPKPPAKQGQ